MTRNKKKRPFLTRNFLAYLGVAMLITALTRDMTWWVTFHWHAHDWIECNTGSRDPSRGVFVYRPTSVLLGRRPLHIAGETVGLETAWMFDTLSIDDLHAHRLPLLYCQLSEHARAIHSLSVSDEARVNSSSSSLFSSSDDE